MKALCVFSGGLDSMLAADLIRAQDIDILALFFETPFFSSETARKSARSIDLPFKAIDITRRHLEVVKNPKHGYGRNMNPCIDCHALMFRIAGELLEEEGADFVITGEVLGQRPFSQNKNALMLITKESGLGGLLLRPLSGKLLPPTLPEEKGWISRERLSDFQGRTRKPQMERARIRNIKKYPAPAGGCLLTEKIFSRRLKDLLSFHNDCKVKEIELLKLGRHFRISSQVKLVVGRNQAENKKIEALSSVDDLILTSVDSPGPTVLASGNSTDEALNLAAGITAAYSDTEDRTSSNIKIIGENTDIRLSAMVRDKAEFRRYMI